MNFEWDETKRIVNLEKHKVDFPAATLIFQNQFASRPDSRRDYGEARKIALGQSGDLVLVVVYVERGNTIRVISARKAGRHERNYLSEILTQRN